MNELPQVTQLVNGGVRAWALLLVARDLLGRHSRTPSTNILRTVHSQASASVTAGKD